jgi:uncharacterized protein YdeI (YjbR/CyaY-like superfamily)
MPTELKIFYPKDRKAWRRWLQKYHKKETGVWLTYYRKNSGKSHVSYDDAVEEALCFGWIDSITKPIDEEKYMQKFTPRKVKSVWSALNKRRVGQLIGENLMAPAGLAIIDLGKQNGSWTKLDHVENFVIPPDLAQLLAKNKKVLKYFEGLAKSVRKQWLYRLGNAKLPETRAKRIADIIDAAEKDALRTKR